MGTTPSPCSPNRLTSAKTCSVCATPSAAVGSSRMTEASEFHDRPGDRGTDRLAAESSSDGLPVERIVVTRRLASVSRVFASIRPRGGSRTGSPRAEVMFWTTSRLSQSADPGRRPRSRPRRVLRPADGDRLAVEDHLAVVHAVDPRNALDQGGLARAVVADERLGRSPARTSKSTSVSASTEPNDFETPRSSRRGACIAHGRAGPTTSGIESGSAPGGASIRGRLRPSSLGVLAVADFRPLVVAAPDQLPPVRLRDLPGIRCHPRRPRPLVFTLPVVGRLLAPGGLDRGRGGYGRELALSRSTASRSATPR